MTALPFDDRDGTIWLDGRFVPWREARLHVLSHGLHYGGAVFEGVRVYGGRMFKSLEHAERLRSSARELNYSLPYSADELDAAAREVVRREGIVDGYVRPVAWRGSEQISVSGSGSTPHVAIAAWDWPHVFSADAARAGIRLRTSKWRRPDPATAPVRAKAASLYNICTLARDEAEAAGYDDALLLDLRGALAEATGANLFLVIDGALHTPTPDSFLDGITRQTVIALAADLGIEVVERRVEPGELDHAEEVFLTGTAYEVQPVSGVDERTYRVGKMTAELAAAYARLVRSD
ncbi:branched-chain amino acid aminotransferase [Streptomyces sp. NBC_00513]|uniref:branched-chain amino acid aminotransferase n=1 Tax=unclassified Streptomyces TaxID=2593676 RepID=UPI00225249E4|nr:branched-chain amino acid aminotransferase [Streptomyces sp. NBC_00424]MCX5077358.1 branched-chain amino acid aminotransferase [Streptomyces sp. NBC_00424]WUD39656.1 branched-chain amino acid aminotransferase [Streptomyces sp. NBC_00513]